MSFSSKLYSLRRAGSRQVLTNLSYASSIFAVLASMGAGCEGSIKANSLLVSNSVSDGGIEKIADQSPEIDPPGKKPLRRDAGTEPMQSDSGAPPTQSDGGSPVVMVEDASTPPPPDVPPPPQVANCSNLAAQGTFEDITPPAIKSTLKPGGGGTFAVATDPVNQGTVYVGSTSQKLWKSTDCGANWTAIATGRNADLVNSGMNWSIAVDPIQPNVVYSASGYGGNGLYKSTNGGVDWDWAWPPPAQPELAKAFTYNFANVLALEPANHLHLLLTFHEECLAPHQKTCIAESMDGGVTWRLIDGRPEWNGNEGQVIFFLENSSTWLWGSSTNGYWRTGNSGGSWEQITGMSTTHRQGAQLYRAPNGAFYVSGVDGIWRSPDGKASTWARVFNVGAHWGGMIGSGSMIYASNCYAYGFCTPQYFSSPIDDGTNWTVMNSPNLVEGGTFAYDSAHQLLYSSNFSAGFFRVRVR